MQFNFFGENAIINTADSISESVGVSVADDFNETNTVSVANNFTETNLINRSSDFNETSDIDTSTAGDTITKSVSTADNFTELVKYYDPTQNYSLIETMLTDPVFYEAELNLNIVDIHAFDHFKGVRIDELEGVFYVNKIIDFLATSPGTPTKVELIKIS